MHVSILWESYLILTNAVTQWPGLAHDSFILSQSTVGLKATDRRCMRQLIGLINIQLTLFEHLMPGV